MRTDVALAKREFGGFVVLMRLDETAPTVDPARSRRGSRAGFKLLVFSIAVFVLSVLAALLLPPIQQAQRASRARTVAADFRTFDRAFQKYANDNGDWPAGTPIPGAIPPGMESALSGTDWSRPTPIGGRFVWLTNTYQHGERLRAGIAIVSVSGNPVSDDLRQLDALDRDLDDGHFRVGRLRLGYRNEPVYVMEH